MSRAKGFAATRPGRHMRRLERGGLLLEVIIAIVIMTVTLGVLSSELMMGLRLIQHGEKQTRAAELADRMLSLLELDQQTMQQVFGDQQKEGDFGDEFPGYHWRLTMEPTDTVGLGQFTLQILHNDDPNVRQDIRSARVVGSYSFLKADPGRLDLEKDFGIDLGGLTGDPGGDGSGAPPGDADGGAPNPMAGLVQLLQSLGIDPQNLDPQAIASLPPEVLLQLLPQIMPLIQQMMGGGAPGGPGGGFSLDDVLGGGGIPGMPGAPGGPGGQPGATPPGGSGPGGEWTLEDLLEWQRQMEAGGGGGAPGDGGGRPGPGMQEMPGVGGANPDPAGPNRGGRGGRNPATPGNGGNTPGGTGPNGEWTIEDLLRLEQEMGGGQQNPPQDQPANPNRGRGNANPGGGRRSNDVGGPKPPPGGNRPPARPGGNNAGGGNTPIIQPSGVDENGNPQYTIEDLIRLRDELERRGEGV